VNTARLHAMESVANVAIGYLINLWLVRVLLHGLGYEIRFNENAGIGAVLAAVAFLRGYCIRRTFHKLKG